MMDALSTARSFYPLANDRRGSTSVIRRCLLNVRVTPASDHMADIDGRLNGVRPWGRNAQRMVLVAMSLVVAFVETV
jgi:hypothetical protein